MRNYAEIIDIKERRRLFLDDTIELYSQDPYKLRGKNGYDQGCVYLGVGTSPGCSIGRHLSRDIAKQLDHLGYWVGRVVREMPEMLPKWMVEMGGRVFIGYTDIT